MLVETVCCCPADCEAAERAGAHRIELVAAIEQGGLTPTPGAVKASKRRCSLPVMAMVRPRAGGFVYDDGEFEAMLADVSACLDAGADGVVLGVLHEDGSLDLDRNTQLVRRAQGMPVVCHRAFDLNPDQPHGLEQLISMGFARVLTSGGKSSALAGAGPIRELIRIAAGRIEILPGVEIRASNVRALVERTGCDQVHLGPFLEHFDPPTDREVSYGPHVRLDAQAVWAVAQAA
jgi:copper homeostasis protein